MTSIDIADMFRAGVALSEVETRDPTKDQAPLAERLTIDNKYVKRTYFFFFAVFFVAFFVAFFLAAIAQPR